MKNKIAILIIALSIGALVGVILHAITHPDVASADVQVEAGPFDYDWFDIPDSTALVTVNADGSQNIYPIPPQSVIGIQHRWFDPTVRKEGWY